MISNNNDIEILLQTKSKNIDISEDAYLKAIKFQKQLEKDYGDEWEIYPQGSVRYGTVIKSDYEKTNYDIDLMAKNLTYNNLDYTDKESKDLKLKGKPKSTKKVSEKKPCWTIKVNDTLTIDITPSVNDTRKNQNVSYSKLSEKVTRKKDDSSYGWKDSNPKGYYQWFKLINQKAYNISYEHQKNDLEGRLIGMESYNETIK